MCTKGPRRLVDATTPDALWGHPLANEYLAALCGAYGSRGIAAVRRLAAGCGIGTAALPGGSASVEETWVAVLEAAAPTGRLRDVARAVCTDPAVSEHEEHLRALAEWDFEARVETYLNGLLGPGRPSRLDDNVEGLVGRYVDLSALPTQPHIDRGSPLAAYIRFADGGDWPQVEGVFRPAATRGTPGEDAALAKPETVPLVARRLAETARTTPRDEIASDTPWPRTVLLGEPGSGKTWTLMRVLVAHGLAWLEADSAARRDLPIPVFVPLREFSGRRGTPDGGFAAETFDDFLTARFRELAPIRDVLLRQDRVALLLDAFNEMPRRVPEDETRDLVAELLTAIRDVRSFVLSCRKRDYRNEFAHVPELAQLELQDLDPPKIQAVIAARFGETEAGMARQLWQAIGGSEALLAAWAKAVAGDFARDFWRHEWRPPYGWEDAEVHFEDAERRAVHALHEGARLMHLARNPFRLGLLIRTYVEDRAIPPNRAALFEKLIGQLLAAEAGRVAPLQQPWSAGGVDDVCTAMESVALALQAAGRTALPRATLEKAIAQEDGPALLDAALDANLLTQPSGEVAFDHQLFQEYFAARALLPGFERDEPPTKLFAQGEGWWDPHVWRETFHILAEHVAKAEAGREQVAHWLASVSPEVALDVATQDDAGPEAYQVLPDDLRELLAEAARARVDEGSGLYEKHPYGRNAAYRVLGRLHSDDREGIDVVVVDKGLALPNIAWCPVPGSPFVYQEGERHELPAFDIARYPVTWRQFQAFVDDPEGYGNEAWWQAGPEEPPEAPVAAAWPIANHPREMVSWFEAMAFCAWLTARLHERMELERNKVVRLPSEQEWEKAARGKKALEYPWEQEVAGNREYRPGSANIDETDRFGFDVRVGDHFLGRMSAVGAYRACRSPFGTYDMAGNVWEWCLDTYHAESGATSSFADPRVARVVRGGSWLSDLRNARASYRNGLSPGSRDYDVGFRFVCASPISW